MKLSLLLQEVDYKLIQGDLDIEISDLIFDSRNAKEGVAFVSLIGTVDDGHRYISAAIAGGAVAVVVEAGSSYEKVPSHITVIETANTRITLAKLSAAYFRYPQNELVTIGVTGTKGKTTTTYMIRNMLESCGIKTGLIGTIEIIAGEQRVPSINTTPESYIIEQAFRKMVDEGCKAVVMEVSSQGLKMHRTSSITFDYAVFTNIGNDHIGPNEHHDFNEYLNSKARLFSQCKKAIVNLDDEHVQDILKDADCEIISFGLSQDSDYRASNIELTRSDSKVGISYDVIETYKSNEVFMKACLGLPGMFSVYNSLCAIAVAKHMGIKSDIIKKSIENIHVQGRVEPVYVSDRFSIMIDYAHNAMALESVLKTLKDYNPNRLVVLFGCGGNRAKSRRYSMGEVAGKFADFTIITSDNPRYELPEDIIEDIKSGINKTDGKYISIVSRIDAIEYALMNSQDGDIIVLAGKGHEDYQEIAGIRYPMDEKQIVIDTADKLRKEGYII